MIKAFDKIIGYKSIKEELQRLADILKNSEKYKLLGVEEPSGLLINGNPGLGKTLMANVLIEASGRKSFTCRKTKSNGAFVDELKDIFDKAVKEAPSIVLLDDMDKFSNEDFRHRNSEEYVAVQSCIDEVKGKHVYVVATVNETENLPESLMRIGRFDHKITVKPPTGKDAELIIKHYLSNKSYVKEITASSIAKMFSGRSVAELESVINEAGLRAGYLCKDKIDLEDITKATLRVIYDAPENIEAEGNDYIKALAYHEAGHTVVQEILEPDSVNLVSIQKNIGDIGGVTSYENNQYYFYDIKYMKNRVLSILGGKAATEVEYGVADVGCNNDLHRAFDIVGRFVDNYCSYDFATFYQHDSSNELQERKSQRISLEMQKYYNMAKQIIIENKLFLDAVASALVKNTVLSYIDISKIKDKFEIKKYNLLY